MHTPTSRQQDTADHLQNTQNYKVDITNAARGRAEYHIQ
jgi:hypothetical protein